MYTVLVVVGIFIVVLLMLMAGSLIGISGSLRRILEHNLKFAPPEAGDRSLHKDDIVVLNAFGIEQIVVIKEVCVNPDGTHTLAVEPLGVLP